MMSNFRNLNFEEISWVFLCFLYIYKGLGDSSGNAIQEEWQLVCNLRESYLCFCVFIFSLYLQGGWGLLWQCNFRGVAASLQFKGILSFFGFFFS